MKIFPIFTRHQAAQEQWVNIATHIINVEKTLFVMKVNALIIKIFLRTVAMEIAREEARLKRSK